MIAVIAFALFAFIIGDLFSSGGFSTNQRCRKHQWQGYLIEDFRIKVSNVKVLKELLTAAANRVWDQEVSVALLTSEFDKLGLRVGEKHLLAVLKADPNKKSNVLVCLILRNLKNTQANPAQAQYLKDRE
jgi:peptidyl-prolyl cis-trans isomerase D